MAGGFKWINTYKYEARNLPEQCLLEIGRKLSDEVEILAGELGLDNAKLEEARETKCPAMSVLKAWSKRPCTTVLVLYNILNKLNRQDAIDVLEKHISEVELNFVVETKTGLKSLCIQARTDDKMADVIENIPGLHGCPHLNFSMENPKENILERKASEFKGIQIHISTLKKNHTKSDYIKSSTINNLRGPASVSVTLPVPESTPSTDTDVKQKPEDCQEGSRHTRASGDQLSSSTTDTYMNLQHTVHIWPLLTDYEEEVILQPYINQPGTFIVRKSRSASDSKTICVIDTDSQIIHFRIFCNENDDVYLFPDEPVFHNISELTSYYRENNICKNNDGKTLKLIRNI